MMLPSPGFIPDAVLEQRAVNLLREHESRKERSICLPIPIEEIIEQTLDLRVVWLPIEEQSGEIILARIDPNYLGHPTIQMNENRASHFETFFGTEQFSLAHELGHWILHFGRGHGRQLGLIQHGEEVDDRPRPCRRMSDGDRRELQADRFAAYLLLPGYLVRPASTHHDLTRWDGMAAFARHCGVSKRAMARRLDALKLAWVGSPGKEETSSHSSGATLF